MQCSGDKEPASDHLQEAGSTRDTTRGTDGRQTGNNAPTDMEQPVT